MSKQAARTGSTNFCPTARGGVLVFPSNHQFFMDLLWCTDNTDQAIRNVLYRRLKNSLKL
ncbi:hypothetical protein ADM96_16290 [Burkholderia sp. ST111]|nr:hypothetical protein ADM96_16290 [Burkholderia sp. ST111]